MNKQTFVISSLLIVALGMLCVFGLRSVGRRLTFVPEQESCTAKGCFESIMDFTCLYDGPRKIARVGNRSISPSGAYAAFEGASFEHSGKIMLYDRASGKLGDITDGGFAIPETFQWDEQHSKLAITYYQENPNPIYAKHPPSTVRLR